MMKILIISGFLGAGKTTFIKALAKNTGKEFAILENEYGSAGIDGDVLRSDLAGGDMAGGEMAGRGGRTDVADGNTAGGTPDKSAGHPAGNTGANTPAGGTIASTSDANTPAGGTIASTSDAGTIGGKVNIWELTEGCICCSTKEDFAASVLTIAGAVDPEYLVVEPTGVAMLSQIIHKLRQIEYERITLLAPVAIVDGHSCDRYIREYPDLYRDQISHAHTIFVSKMEHASPRELERLGEKLRRISPHSKIITEHYSLQDKSQWLALLKHGYGGQLLQDMSDVSGVSGVSDVSGVSGVSMPQNLPDTFSMKGVSLKSPEHLLMLMEALIHGECGNVFRAKGQVLAGDQFFRFDLADGLYSITGSQPLRQENTTGTSNALSDTEAAEEKVVFIGTDLARQKIRRYFLQSSLQPPEEIHLLSRGSVVL